eukprot:CAMPEP_0173469900 /NCGR_PEP_ID=MMETSP1357-20121228/77600_1 /TAXON_ID=77926 /ORGANISM="Hemiselmis rufescens, Strain PCC563" /LENGTH=768 /DNA_ID=CAMNT_0014438155 /DNA_START=480 /DNA_END=2783 /DNA_ORIENTATION=+
MDPDSSSPPRLDSCSLADIVNFCRATVARGYGSLEHTAAPSNAKPPIALWLALVLANLGGTMDITTEQAGVCTDFKLVIQQTAKELWADTKVGHIMAAHANLPLEAQLPTQPSLLIALDALDAVGMEAAAALMDISIVLQSHYERAAATYLDTHCTPKVLIILGRFCTAKPPAQVSECVATLATHHANLRQATISSLCASAASVTNLDTLEHLLTIIQQMGFTLTPVEDQAIFTGGPGYLHLPPGAAVQALLQGCPSPGCRRQSHYERAAATYLDTHCTPKVLIILGRFCTAKPPAQVSECVATLATHHANLRQATISSLCASAASVTNLDTLEHLLTIIQQMGFTLTPVEDQAIFTGGPGYLHLPPGAAVQALLQGCPSPGCRRQSHYERAAATYLDTHCTPKVLIILGRFCTAKPPAQVSECVATLATHHANLRQATISSLCASAASVTNLDTLEHLLTIIQQMGFTLTPVEDQASSLEDQAIFTSLQAPLYRHFSKDVPALAADATCGCIPEAKRSPSGVYTWLYEKMAPAIAAAETTAMMQHLGQPRSSMAAFAVLPGPPATASVPSFAPSEHSSSLGTSLSPQATAFASTAGRQPQPLWTPPTASAPPVHPLTWTHVAGAKGGAKTKTPIPLRLGPLSTGLPAAKPPFAQAPSTPKPPPSTFNKDRVSDYGAYKSRDDKWRCAWCTQPAEANHYGTLCSQTTACISRRLNQAYRLEALRLMGYDHELDPILSSCLRLHPFCGPCGNRAPDAEAGTTLTAGKSP